MVARVVVVIALLWGAWLGSAPALAADAGGIRQGIVDYLRTFHPFLQHEEVTVEDRGGRFEVLITGLHYSVGVTRYLDFDRLAFTVAPAEQGLYRVDDVRLPKTMTIRDANDAEVGRLTLTLERMTGLLSPAIRNFLDFDVAITDLAVVVPADGAAAKLADLTLRVESERGADGLWSMASRYAARGFGFIGQFATIDIAEFGFDTEMTGLALEAYGDMMTRFEERMGKGSPEEMFNAVFGELFFAGPKLAADFDVTFFLKGMRAAEAGGGVGFALDDVRLRLVTAGLRETLSRMEIALEHSGLRLDLGTEATGDPALGLVPEALTLELAAVNVPFQDMETAVAGFLGTFRVLPGGDAKGGAEAAPQQLGTEVMDAMAKAGTTLNLAKSSFVSPALKAELEGSLKVDAGALMGAVGTLRTRIVGYDNLFAILSTPERQQALATLLMLRVATERSQDEQGNVVDNFRFDLTREGAMLINGLTIEQVMQQQQQ